MTRQSTSRAAIVIGDRHACCPRRCTAAHREERADGALQIEDEDWNAPQHAAHEMSTRIRDAKCMKIRVSRVLCPVRNIDQKISFTL
jgi:hypothetical protein